LFPFETFISSTRISIINYTTSTTRTCRRSDINHEITLYVIFSCFHFFIIFTCRCCLTSVFNETGVQKLCESRCTWHRRRIRYITKTLNLQGVQTQVDRNVRKQMSKRKQFYITSPVSKERGVQETGFRHYYKCTGKGFAIYVLWARCLKQNNRYFRSHDQLNARTECMMYHINCMYIQMATNAINNFKITQCGCLPFNSEVSLWPVNLYR
jgi:hypothetical protein